MRRAQAPPEPQNLRLARFTKATQQVGPTFWPKRQYPHHKYKKEQRHGHLHNTELWGIFCHNPAGRESRDNQKPSGSPTEHDTSSSTLIPAAPSARILCGRPELVVTALRAAWSVVEVRPLVAAVHDRGESIVPVHDGFDEDQPIVRRAEDIL